ncbi:MAG TPA: hypothetical protein VGH76_17315 [Actinomycetospora sp.]|jgi:hypothetical protein|uniref:hypothetical protein n=1 Tax=Actinomycetospora sp. TaxID=1872135 RepID=UPI002F3E45F5
MARSRHGRSGGGSSPADSGLPSWAQRHLDEAGEPDVDTAALAARTHHRRAAAQPSRMRGWGVAIVSVAAAVGAVPLAISSVANDHSDDPLPRVDTYTAGSPGPLQGGAGAGGTTQARPGQGGTAGGDAATGGVLDAPPAAPQAVAPGRVIAAPLPAAVVRATPTVVPPPVVAPVVPRTATTPTTSTGRSATKPPKASTSKPPKSNPKPAPKPSGGGGSNGGGSGGGGGGLLGNVVGGVTRTAGGAVNGLLG